MEITPLHFCDLTVEGEVWPVYGWAIHRPGESILVDTGMIDSTPELDAEWGVRFDAAKIPRDVLCVVNTHLHFDHCGGNRLFAGTPIHVQRIEREAARRDGYTIPEWVEFDGATYVEHEGEAELLPGVRLLPTPGHTDGHQSVLVDTDDGLVVLAGDVGYTWKAFDASESGQLLMSLRPRRIWLAHAAEPRDLP
jgi:N-acyl homoserine lactone hydrolase